MYRIQVASDSAGNLSSSRLLLEFIWSISEIQQSIEMSLKVALERNWTRDHLFTEVSPPKSCYSQWKHRCFYPSCIQSSFRLGAWGFLRIYSKGLNFQYWESSFLFLCTPNLWLEKMSGTLINLWCWLSQILHRCLYETF